MYLNSRPPALGPYTFLHGGNISVLKLLADKIDKQDIGLYGDDG